MHPQSAQNDNQANLAWPEDNKKKAALSKLRRVVSKLENSETASLCDSNAAYEEKRAAPSEEVARHQAESILRRGWFHEFWADIPAYHTSAMAMLLEGIQKNGQMILWVLTPNMENEYGIPYGPGLLMHGIDPERIILVRTASEQEALWAMDEGLKTSSLAAVVGETTGMPLSASRRLSLTAKEHKIRFLHLIRISEPPSSASFSRWHVKPIPSNDACNSESFIGPTRLGICPVKHRQGHPPAPLSLEWKDETHNFGMASKVADRPLAQSQEPQRQTN
ncbi:MAG: hypothetical protein HWE25_13165 [Alphaproteobacteria bacterium]|nr:hypothetical protein [Alphaproteobacteria bacterium]